MIMKQFFRSLFGSKTPAHTTNPATKAIPATKPSPVATTNPVLKKTNGDDFFETEPSTAYGAPQQGIEVEELSFEDYIRVTKK
jgi:hypothetical protein